jgi:hypothetical protein
MIMQAFKKGLEVPNTGAGSTDLDEVRNPDPFGMQVAWISH